jgi:hypothetical protein
MAFRTWRSPFGYVAAAGVAFLGVARARRSRFAAPLSGYCRSAGEPLSAFAARLTAPIWRDEIQQRNWVCRTGAAVVIATIVTAAVVTAVVAVGVRTPARVETAACVKTAASATTAAADVDSAATAMTATAPREHGRSSDRNNHGDRCN